MAKDEVTLLEMGERIKELRESHGYKQKWLADEVGVELRTYQFWQQGKSRPEQENLEKLAELFGVTPKYILRGDTPEMSSSSQLDRIEEALAELNQRVSQVEQDLEAERAQVAGRVGEAAQQFEEIQNAMGQLLARRQA